MAVNVRVVIVGRPRCLLVLARFRDAADVQLLLQHQAGFGDDDLLHDRDDRHAVLFAHRRRALDHPADRDTLHLDPLGAQCHAGRDFLLVGHNVDTHALAFDHSFLDPQPLGDDADDAALGVQGWLPDVERARNKIRTADSRQRRHIVAWQDRTPHEQG